MRIEGENRPGLGHVIAKALGDAGVNIDFFLGQVSGNHHSTVIGFANREDAERAMPFIRDAAAAPRKPVVRKATGKGIRATKRPRAARRR